jgi:HEAT repeat protein/energy-coupling factor transporter ATP-binding protein EcfA2
MWDIIQNWIKHNEDNKIVIAILAAIIGAILTKLVPYLWKGLIGLVGLICRKIGGRFAYRNFRNRYLDWVVTEMRELKLTGIVAHDDAKKPQLEQVFVSLRVGDNESTLWPSAEFTSRPIGTIASDYFVEKYFKNMKDVKINLSGSVKERLFEQMEFELSDRNLIKITRALRSQITKKGLNINNYEYQKLLKEYEQLIGQRLPRSGKIMVRNSILQSDSFGLPANVKDEDQLCDILKKDKRIAILGSPGAGKTTLLQHIALAYAREKAGDSKLRERGLLFKRLGTKYWRLPIFIPLSTIASLLADLTPDGRDPSIVDVLTRILPPDFQRDFGQTATKYFTKMLEKQKAILLFDGLDEVPTMAEFQVVIRGIESLVLRYKENQYVITSRIAGWRSGVNADFKTYYVKDLDDDQVNTFIDSWYTAVERNAVIGRLEDESNSERTSRERRANQRAKEMKQTLKENEGIRRLATNPMLLSIIALVHRSLATLPKERAKLYAECSKILLEQWDVSRGVRVDDTKLKLDQKETVMRRLAFAYHTGEIGDKGGGRTANRNEVERIIAEILPSLGRPKEDAEHLLQRLVERSGVITERQRDILSFSHHTLQEYFTAQYLAKGEQRKFRDFLLEPSRLFSDWWKEVILLYAGLLSDSSDFLSAIRKKDDDFCKRRLRLAALALGETIGVKQTSIRQQIAVDLLKVRTRGDLQKVLSQIESEAIENLIKWSTTNEWNIFAAWTTVKEIHNRNGAEEVYKIIEASLESNDKEIRIAALDAILFTDKKKLPDQLINKILQTLDGNDPQIKEKAIDIVGCFKNIPSNIVVGKLKGFLKQDSPSLRRASLRTIAKLDPKLITTNELQQELKGMTEDSDAQRLCWDIFPHLANQLSPDELKIFFSYDDFRHLSAMEVIAKQISDPSLEKLAHSVLELIRDSDSRVRNIAISVLSYLSKDSPLCKDVIQELFSLVTSESKIKYTLQRLSEKGLQSLITDKIKEELLINKSRISTSVLEVLQIIGAKCVGILSEDELLEMLQCEDIEKKLATIRNIVNLVNISYQGRIAKQLLRLTEDRSIEVRTASLQVLNSSSLVSKQEYLAACRENLKNRATILVITAAGLLLKSGDKSDKEQATKKLVELLTKDMLINHLRRIVVRRHRLPMKVIFELRDILRMLASTDVVLASDTTKKLIKRFTISEVFYEGMPFNELLALHHEASPEELFDQIIDAISSMSELSYSAELDDALVNLGQRIKPVELDDRINRLLNNNNVRIRQMGIKLLVACNDKLSSVSILDRIGTALEDRDIRNRIVAFDVINPFLSIPKLSKGTHNLLLMKLHDDNQSVREKAWDIYSKRMQSLGQWT